MRWSGAIYTALAVLAIVAWQLFTARAVRLDIDPPTAEIDIAGAWLAIPAGDRRLLHPGDYQLRLRAPGYEPLEQALTITDANNQEFRFALTKLPGRLEVVTPAGVEARIWVDGKAVPVERGAPLRVAAGTRAIRVEAPRYLPFETTLNVEGRDQLQTLTAELVPNWAEVTVSSRPQGAMIIADGVQVGVTPATIAIEAGTRRLEVRRDGFKPWRQSLSVAARDRLELPAIDLQEADGVLTVESTPPGAAVTVDGRFRGTTPVDIDVAPGRSHEVIVARAGYETVTRKVAFERRGGQSLRVELVPRIGVVRVRAVPEDAELLIDGATKGRANQELRLPAVPHRVEIRRDGYTPYTAAITPNPVSPLALDVKLLTPEQAVLAASPRTVKTGQGLVLRLVEPGRFEMGAPRREQGRRPNESQRTVTLTRRFYIGTREITNREFREFKPNHTSGAQKYQELAGGEHPAVLLSWDDAVTFCNWLSDRESLPRAYAPKDGAMRLVEPLTTGYRLPTEAEWEWATRYNGGGGQRRYPWGNQMPPAPGSGNFADESARSVVPNVVSGYDDGYPVTAPVGKFAASPIGLYDSGGNAAEWVHDIYTVYSGTAQGEAADPLGPASGQYHAIRGSSWRHSSISELRYAYRDFGDQGRLDVGFRIARYAD
jgi:formylglycine-generating enzyme required for sulfatase activity